jgi:hypothetical protein
MYCIFMQIKLSVFRPVDKYEFSVDLSLNRTTDLKFTKNPSQYTKPELIMDVTVLFLISWVVTLYGCCDVSAEFYASIDETAGDYNPADHIPDCGKWQTNNRWITAVLCRGLHLYMKIQCSVNSPIPDY